MTKWESFFMFMLIVSMICATVGLACLYFGVI